MLNQNDDHDSNNLRTYIGIVAETKELESRIAKINCPEITPTLSGPISDRTKRESVELMDVNGNKYNTIVHTTNTITAEYWGGDTNRVYPPDIVKGEVVIIYQYANSDTYYWDSISHSDDLRCRERYRIACANSPNTTKVLSDDNTYWFEIDTINKRVTIGTSDGDGEKFIYRLLIDPSNTKFHVYDNIGNEIYLNSEESIVRLQNSKGSFISANALDVFVVAKRDAVVKAGRQIVYNAPVYTFQNTSGTGVSVMNTNGMKINASESFVVSSPIIGFDGTMKVNGTLVAGPMRAEGYSTGVVGSSYAGASTSIPSGSGSVPSNTPDTAASGSGNRHCTAQEDILKAVQDIVTAIHLLEDEVGITTSVDDAIGHTEDSLMGKNMGD